ncbi:amino acid deaminase/aldolase [Thermomonospora cellulosilytica]|uniref:D-serine deaminase-like pyridoxal phosphate-dependent protein n=1 Tax=Thermomonospora cellulosilytica TaxID=1411118 RepID=A0A7W3RC24_9ACTN|nr:amino acid deaminase/aldolase [Thermomonospora cellulosilytica]MBA9007637.1 D-serine deaminase-like pyridoxal phosphate-dependent protein [Thermomonospora cellulosilytica]
MNLRKRYDTATAALPAPLAIVDMDAFRANAADLVRRAAGKPIRVASKSVRCRALLAEVLAMDGFAGIMAFTLPEALWLAAERMSDDILVAYPTADETALARLAADDHARSVVTVLVDSPDHLAMIERAAGHAPGPIRVCMDIDAGYRLLGGRIRIGARRSSIHDPAQAAAFAARIARHPTVTLVGLMAYESQIAGVGDEPPGNPARAKVIKAMQARSRLELARRRAAVVRAVREVTPGLEFVNGGGTGSVEKTAAERAVTEIAAGSGLYQPHLFDYYSNFTGRPAALFALPVVRRPGPGVVTCLGGGYLASGPADRLRLPQPYLPRGLSYDANEGAGEVQTPLLGAAADELAIGDRVWFRHTKAGELCERFDTLHLVEGDTVVKSVPTYRGEGRTFL